MYFVPGWYNFRWIISTKPVKHVIRVVFFKNRNKQFFAIGWLGNVENQKWNSYSISRICSNTESEKLNILQLSKFWSKIDKKEIRVFGTSYTNSLLSDHNPDNNVREHLEM